MSSAVVLLIAGLSYGADAAGTPVPPSAIVQVPTGPTFIPPLPTTPASPPQSTDHGLQFVPMPPPPPLVPPWKAWWIGARIPVAYQRQVYYPNWDVPLRVCHGEDVGTPAPEVPQTSAAPAYWYPVGGPGWTCRHLPGHRNSPPAAECPSQDNVLTGGRTEK